MADAFVDSIGVNTHLYYTDTQYGNFRGYAPLLEASGIRHVRDGNANPNVNNRLAQMYPLYRSLAAHGIRTTWINDPRIDSQTVQQDVGNIAAMGSGVVEAMEGPNEYDASGDANWASDLRTFQAQLYSATKAAYPRLPVIGPSVGAQNAQTLGNISASVDEGNMHPYALWPPKPLSATLDNEIRLHETYAFPGRPMAATEFGYPTATQAPGSSYSVSEMVQAKYVARAYLEGFSRGVLRMWDYQLLDQCATASNQECHFGLIRYDNSPKPAYGMLRNLIQLLSDPGPAFATGGLGYQLSGDTSAVHQLLLEKRDRTFTLLLWLDVPSNDADTTTSVTVSFNEPMSVTTYLPLASASPRESHPSVRSLTLAVPDHPLLLRVAAPAAGSATSRPSAQAAAPPPTAAAAQYQRPSLLQPRRRPEPEVPPPVRVTAVTPDADHRLSVVALLLAAFVAAAALLLRRRRFAGLASAKKGPAPGGRSHP